MIPTWVANIFFFLTDAKYCQGYGESRTFVHCWWKCQLVFLETYLEKLKLTRLNIGIPMTKPKQLHFQYMQKNMHKYDHKSLIRSSDFPTEYSQEHIVKNFQCWNAPFMWILAGTTWLRRLFKRTVLGTLNLLCPKLNFKDKKINRWN